MKEQRISPRLLGLEKLTTSFPVIGAWLVYAFWFSPGFLPFMVALFITALALPVLLSKHTCYTEDYVRFGKQRFPYSDICGMNMLEVNGLYLIMFKLKAKTIFQRYKITVISFPSLWFVVTVILFRKKKKLAIEQFHELLLTKSAIPPTRWVEILGKKSYIQQRKRIKKAQQEAASQNAANG